MPPKKPTASEAVEAVEAPTKPKITAAKTIEKFFITESERESTATASGDFTYIRDFTMVNEKGADLNPNPAVNGYILQKITKSVNVTVPDPENGKPSVLTTTADVMDYTSGFVNSMSDSYIEAFIVVKGYVTEGDMFRNSSILRYAEDGHIADDAPDTEGVIKQTGVYYFVPSANNSKAAITKELAEKGIHVIKGENQPNPANGLPCSTDISLFEKIKPQRKSPIYKFALTISWNADSDDSSVNPTAQVVLTQGGKHRSTGKRKTRKRV